MRRAEGRAEQHDAERGAGERRERAQDGAGRHVAGGVGHRGAPAEQQQRQHAEQDPGQRSADRHTRPDRAEHREHAEHRGGGPGLARRPAGLGGALPEHLDHVVVERLADAVARRVQEQQLALPDPRDGQRRRRVEPGAVETAQGPPLRGGRVLLGEGHDAGQQRGQRDGGGHGEVDAGRRSRDLDPAEPAAEAVRLCGRCRHVPSIGPRCDPYSGPLPGDTHAAATGFTSPCVADSFLVDDPVG